MRIDNHLEMLQSLDWLQKIGGVLLEQYEMCDPDETWWRHFQTHRSSLCFTKEARDEDMRGVPDMELHGQSSGRAMSKGSREVELS